MAKTEITVMNVIPAQRKNSRWKTTPEEFYANKEERLHAKISADRKTITVFGKDYKGNDFSRSFSVGDHAEYDSFNLSYYGPILSISDKSVTIEEQYTTRRHRLDLYTFCWRNRDFDLSETEAKNQETMHYI